MSREIKFRAWDKQDHRMITAEQDFIPLLVCHKGILRLNPHHEENLYNLLDGDRFEVMQFTGLLDKNGKECYEGDILKYQHSPESKEYVCAVSYNNKFCSFWLSSGTDTGFAFLGHQQVLEIIGNIYSNPELIISNKTT